MRSILSLFSFYGRARRTSYGIFFSVTVFAYFVFSIPFTIWSIQKDKQHFVEQIERSNPKQAHLFDPILNIPHDYITAAFVMSGIAVMILYVAWIALTVRRLHDMNATGWLVLIAIVAALVPFAGYLLVMLVLGVWPGSKGINRYGPDPRDPGALADVFGRDGYRLEGAPPRSI